MLLNIFIISQNNNVTKHCVDVLFYVYKKIPLFRGTNGDVVEHWSLLVCNENCV